MSDPFKDDKASEVEGEAQSPSQDASDPGELLPAPGGPQPPGKRDTEVPPELPGEILPPSMLDGEPEEKPPGQILLPDSVQNGHGVPDQLRLHPSLSGGSVTDGKIENMLVGGEPLDLERTYRFVTSGYLAQGNVGYEIMLEHEAVPANITLMEAVTAYIGELGEIEADNQTRIIWIEESR